MKTTNYNVRLNPEIKAKAEEVFAVFGMNLSDAINIFLHKSILEHGLPFEVQYKQPNAETLQAIAEAEKISQEYRNGIRTPEPFTCARDMIAEILADEDDCDV